MTMPDVMGFMSAMAGIGAPMVIGGAVHIVRKVHQQATAISVLQAQQAASDAKSEGRHRETREDLMEIKQVMRDVQRHVLDRL